MMRPVPRALFIAAMARGDLSSTKPLSWHGPCEMVKVATSGNDNLNSIDLTKARQIFTGECRAITLGRSAARATSSI